MDNPKPATNPTETILVVDDEPINVSVFGELLTPYYKVLVASSGERALHIAGNMPKPDLILLDVMMPGMDGYQVVTLLKENPDTRDIPVIFVTALNSDFEEERGLQAGAVDFVNKPCHMSTLLARIRTHLELKKARDWLKNQNAILEAEVERRQQENQQVHLQLLQSEKLAAIGQLAAGVAHEINNPIGFVNSNLNTLSAYVRDIFNLLNSYDALIANEPIAPETLEKIRALKIQKDLDYLRTDAPQLIAESLDGLARVRSIVQDLKNFSRVDSNNWELTDLHKSIDSTLNMVWNELKYHCTVHKEYGDTPAIYCLPSQLHQVFMNLLINAAQAIKGKGDITIRTGHSADEVWIEIADTGSGISPEHINRLFEPFFTTKPVGKGTGLGLSISQNIVEKHRGRIEVNSEINKGTTFRICLPIQHSE